MNKPNSTAIAKRIKSAAIKRCPEILTGIGIAGMITTTVIAVRATPKALIIIEDKKKEEKTDNLSPKEMVKAAWKCYISVAVMGGVSILCLIGASSVNVRRNAALATAYTLSETALREYREKVVETIGVKKEEGVRDAIAKEKIEHNPVNSKEIIITGKGNTLCYDAVSGRYFHSDIEKIRKAENDLNRQMRDEMYISLNEFYYELGLNPVGIGDDLGWNINQGYIDLDFSSQLANDGTPCLVINYRVAPFYDYMSM